MRRYSKRRCVDCDKSITFRALRCSECHNRLHAKRGPANHQWKGGRIQTGRGYVLVQRSPGQRGRIAEHRLVMEGILGRPLLASESVHHRNGQKNDNRPENLELWSSMHPGGQRVADLVKWAKAVLDKYEDAVERLP